jgi:signal transduction histidine kinase
LKSVNENGRVELFILLSLELFDVDNPKAFEFSNQAYELSKKLGDSTRIVKSGRICGQLLRRLDKLEESIAILNEVYPIAKRNKFIADYKRILNGLAVSYTFKANYDEALRYHFESLLIREAEGNEPEISVALNNIGFVYFKLRNYEKALEFYTKSLNAKRNTKDIHDLDLVLLNIGLCYSKIGNYSAARNHIEQGLAACNGHCSDEIKIQAQFGLGICDYESKKYAESKMHFNESLRIAKENTNRRFEAEDLVYLARIAVEEDQIKEAEGSLIQCEKLATTSGYNQILIDAYQQFSYLYDRSGDYRKMSFYQKKYIRLKDSIYSDELIKNLAKVQTNYAERENIKTIKEKDQILELKQALINRQRAQYVFIIAITLLVLGLGLVLLVANKRQQRVSAELADAKLKIEEQNRMLAQQNKELEARVKMRTAELSKSNKMLIEVNSELDNFLYKTSHDIRGPLVTLKGLCNLALREAEQPSLRDILDKLEGQSDKMAKILNRLTAVGKVNQSYLTPVKINFKAILDGILRSEEANSQPRNVKVTYDIAGNVSMISDSELVTNILENLIDNGIKFYNSSTRVSPFVHVAVSQESNHVLVKVEDNGIGILNAEHDQVFHMFMRASERSDTGGVGLYLAKICTDKLGGEIKLEKSSSEGSMFVIQFPLDLSTIIVQRKLQQEELQKQRELEAELENKLKLTSA